MNQEEGGGKRIQGKAVVSMESLASRTNPRRGFGKGCRPHGLVKADGLLAIGAVSDCIMDPESFILNYEEQHPVYRMDRI